MPAYPMVGVGGKSIEYRHRVRAEQALGKPLPPKAVVHHADGSTSVDAPLVICEDQRYHFLLHTRMRVKAAGGNPNTDRICYTCKTCKPMTAFVPCSAARGHWYCHQCEAARHRRMRARRKVSQ